MDTYSNRKSKMTYFILAAFIAIIFGLARLGTTSGDYYFMLAHGKDMLENGLYRNIDIFSVHHGYFLYQKWAMCIVLYLLYSLGGMFLIDITATILISVLFFFIMTLMYESNSRYSYINLLIVSVCMMLCVSEFVLRPHLFTCFVLIGEFEALERFTCGRLTKIKFLLVMTLFSIITMWFHSTMWVLCVLPVIPYFFNIKGHLFIERNYQKKPLIICLLLMIVVTILQPNFFEQYDYMLKCIFAMNSSYKDYIYELGMADDFGTLLVFFMSVVFYGIILFYNKKIFVPHFLLFLGYCFMALLANRMLVFYFVIYCLCIAKSIGILELEKIQRKYDDIWNRVFICVVAAIFPISGFVFYQFYGRNIYERWFTKMFSAVDYIVENSNSDDVTKVWLFDSKSGSYSIFNGIEPYVDCRAELYDVRINRQYDVFEETGRLLNNVMEQEDATDSLQFLQDKYDFDYYILQTPTNYSEADDLKFTELFDQGLSDIGTKCFESEYCVVYKVNK